MRKIYFAGPWFDDYADKFYEHAKSIVEKYPQYEVFYPKYHQEKNPDKVFENDVKHVKECDTVIALIERKDTGTAWEIGMAYVLGKKIYLVVKDEESCKKSKTNLMLAKTGKCLPIDRLSFLMNGNITEEDFIHFDGWKGIE